MLFECRTVLIFSYHEFLPARKRYAPHFTHYILGHVALRNAAKILTTDGCDIY